MSDFAETRRVARRSLLATLAIAAAAISAIAFIALLIGAAAGMEGFDEGEDATVLGSVLWFSFMIGAGLALILGLIAAIAGRSANRPEDKRAGLIAIGWFVVAVLAVVVINMLGA